MLVVDDYSREEIENYMTLMLSNINLTPIEVISYSFSDTLSELIKFSEYPQINDYIQRKHILVFPYLNKLNVRVFDSGDEAHEYTKSLSVPSKIIFID